MIITKGMGAILKKSLKGTGKKTKGYMDTDPNVRKGIAKGLREHRKSEFRKTYKKIMKKLGISYDGDFSKIISADLIKDVLKRYGGANFNYIKFFTKTRNFAEKVVASRAKGTTTRLRWSTDDYIANAIALIFTRNTIEQLREELALAKRFSRGPIKTLIPT